MMTRDACSIGRPRRRIGLLLATLAVTAIGSLTGPTASADAALLWNEESYFHFPAWAPDKPRCKPTRTLTLAPGLYAHGAFIGKLTEPDKVDMDESGGNGRVNIRRPGTYYWDVCLEYDTNTWPHKRDEYAVRSGLHRKGSGLGIGQYNRLERHYGDGWYEWGGRLRRLGPPTSDR